MGVSPLQAPDEPTNVTIHLKKVCRRWVDGVEMNCVQVIEKLMRWAEANGCGILDIVENRLVGMKSRGVYETPGGTVLYKAHEKLEEITLDKETQHYKAQMALKFAELVYNGQWYTPAAQGDERFRRKHAGSCDRGM